jgi:type I restriction enzyme M protein
MSEKEIEEKLRKKIEEIAENLGGDLDYRVLLTLMFYKVISDKWLEKAKEYSQKFKEVQAYMLANRNYYFLYDESEGKLLTWHESVKEKASSASLISNLSRVIKLNPEFARMDVLVEHLKTFTSPEYSERLEKMINGFSTLDFSTASPKVLNSLFMWILANYGPEEKSEKKSSEKKGEEFRVTPPEVGILLVKLLGIEPDSSVLDPAVGSGSFLVYAYRHAERKEHEPNIMLYGQEIRPQTAAIAKINMVLNEIKNYEIFVGDSLASPQFSEADYAMTDPRWNQKYDVNNLKTKPEIKKIYMTFSRNGFPKNSMDWGWIQILLYFSRKKAGIVIDNGALFRKKDEKRIREEIVEKDLVEAVIQLPPIFGGNKIQGSVIIFNKNKPEERKGKILFINASNEYEKHPETSAMNRLGEEHIEKIVVAYKLFENIKGLARIVSLEEIAKNDYNLNVTLYVMPIVEQEKIDLEKEVNELENIERERNELTYRIIKISKHITSLLKES